MSSKDKAEKRKPRRDEIEDFEAEAPNHRPRVDRDEQSEYEEWRKERGERGRKRRGHREREQNHRHEDDL
jgi:hypothetical protein